MDQEVVIGHVSRSGVKLATLTVETTETTDQHPFNGWMLRNVHWKRISSASKDDPPVVNRLVTSVTRDIEIEWAYRGAGDVALFRSAADPVSVFEPNGDVTGFLLKCSWVLGQAENAVIHRFQET